MSPTSPRADGPGAGLATFLICLAAIGFGAIPYFAKNLTESGMTAPAVAFYRYAFAALALAPFLLLDRESRRVTAWGVFAGAAVGVGWIGYIQALEIVPVATASVLYMTYPIFTLAIGWLFFGSPPGRRATIAAVVILAAAVIGVPSGGISADQLPALLLALLSPLGFGIAINVLTNRLYRVPPLSRMASVAAGSTLGILPLIALSPSKGVVPGSRRRGSWPPSHVHFGGGRREEAVGGRCSVSGADETRPMQAPAGGLPNDGPPSTLATPSRGGTSTSETA